jgi:hypothetical protein
VKYADKFQIDTPIIRNLAWNLPLQSVRSTPITLPILPRCLIVGEFPHVWMGCPLEIWHSYGKWSIYCIDNSYFCMAGCFSIYCIDNLCWVSYYMKRCPSSLC